MLCLVLTAVLPQDILGNTSFDPTSAPRRNIRAVVFRLELLDMIGYKPIRLRAQIDNRCRLKTHRLINVLVDAVGTSTVFVFQRFQKLAAIRFIHQPEVRDNCRKIEINPVRSFGDLAH